MKDLVLAVIELAENIAITQERDMANNDRIEWPTLALLVGCYGIWGSLTWLSSLLNLWIVIPLLALTLAMHSSLQHERCMGIQRNGRG